VRGVGSGLPAHVEDGKVFRAVGVLRIVAEKMAVFLDIGATTGGVGDDGVDVRLFEGVDDRAREGKRCRLFSGMDAQGATASLFGRRDDFTAFRGEYTDSGGVDVREKCALHAAEKQANAFAGFALGGSDGGNGFLRLYGREKCVHCG
jgi:hypothetical protein